MSNAPKLESVIREVQMTSVTTRQVGQDNKTMWAIGTDGPEVTTFLAGLGNKAKALYEQGTIVDLKVSVVQNGKYTNYYLEDIQASANQAGAQAPVQQAIEQAKQAQEVTFEQFAGQANVERTSIHRQVATKVAASLMSENDGQADFWANVDALAKFYETGVVPGDPVPATVAGEQDAFAAADDDIPF